MKVLKDYTFTWWQMGLLKLAMLAIGVAVGAYWQEVFLPYVTLLVIAGIALGIYLAYIACSK
jgi:hypothetical protein